MLFGLFVGWLSDDRANRGFCKRAVGESSLGISFLLPAHVFDSSYNPSGLYFLPDNHSLWLPLSLNSDNPIFSLYFFSSWHANISASSALAHTSINSPFHSLLTKPLKLILFVTETEVYKSIFSSLYSHWWVRWSKGVLTFNRPFVPHRD